MIQYCTYMRENFAVIAYSQLKLCHFKVAKSDPYIRSIFGHIVYIQIHGFHNLIITIFTIGSSIR